jgi:hypothetical protein
MMVTWFVQEFSSPCVSLYFGLCLYRADRVWCNRKRRNTLLTPFFGAYRLRSAELTPPPAAIFGFTSNCDFYLSGSSDPNQKSQLVLICWNLTCRLFVTTLRIRFIL